MVEKFGNTGKLVSLVIQSNIDIEPEVKGFQESSRFSSKRLLFVDHGLKKFRSMTVYKNRTTKLHFTTEISSVTKQA